MQNFLIIRLNFPRRVLRPDSITMCWPQCTSLLRVLFPLCLVATSHSMPCSKQLYLISSKISGSRVHCACRFLAEVHPAHFQWEPEEPAFLILYRPEVLFSTEGDNGMHVWTT